MIEILYIFVVV